MGFDKGCLQNGRNVYGKEIKNFANFTAWVTQMFSSRHIGYTVETASVTINVEI
jgi:hypothetical protein